MNLTTNEEHSKGQTNHADQEMEPCNTVLKSRPFISRLFAIQIAADPLYNTPLVHWTLCLLPHYGAFAWKPSQGTKLYCLVNRGTLGVNNLPRVVARIVLRSESNPRPLDHESSALTTPPPSHLLPDRCPRTRWCRICRTGNRTWISQGSAWRWRNMRSWSRPRQGLAERGFHSQEDFRRCTAPVQGRRTVHQTQTLQIDYFTTSLNLCYMQQHSRQLQNKTITNNNKFRDNFQKFQNAVYGVQTGQVKTKDFQALNVTGDASTCSQYS